MNQTSMSIESRARNFLKQITEKEDNNRTKELLKQFPTKQRKWEKEWNEIEVTDASAFASLKNLIGAMFGIFRKLIWFEQIWKCLNVNL